MDNNMDKKSRRNDQRKSPKIKLIELWQDKRSFKKRLLISVFPIFFFYFTFVFFGPFEIAMSNAESIIFSPARVASTMGILTIVLFSATTFLVSLLRGKIFNFLSTAFFAAGVAGYLQGNVFNGDLMEALTGDAIAWQTMAGKMVGNLIVWALIIIAAYMLLYFSRKYWRITLKYVSIFLVLIQVIGIISIFIMPKTGETYESVTIDSDVYFSNDDQYLFSSGHNILVVVLDRFDYDYVEDVLEKDPEFFKKLDGFTSYTNATTEFARTEPGINNILTALGGKDAYKLSKAEYFNTSWTKLTGTSSIEKLSKAGYNVGIYGDISTWFGDDGSQLQYINNISYEQEKINYSALIENMLKISAYRYTPIALKPFYWCYSDDVSSGVYTESERYVIDEAQYYEDLAEEFFADSDTKQFKLLHFNGPHAPYTLDANGKRVPLGTDVVEQTMGSFHILYELFAKMKEAEIYDNTEIFILGDHGSAVSDTKPLQKATRIGLFHKEATAIGTELEYSDMPVSQINVLPTILRAAGVENYKDYGTPLDEVDEDNVRYYYKSVVKRVTEGGNNHEAEVHVYKITGDASNFKNWEKIDVYEIPDNCWFY
ncbi:MAG: hypothetical protein E7675_01745 [Ruminococcaceae bacterium]|nr:hypothetical protein [Oscillospiraceae bacterium]